MKIKIFVSTNKVGSTTTRIVEIPNELSKIEIDEEAWDYACEMINFDYQIIEDEPIKEDKG